MGYDLLLLGEGESVCWVMLGKEEGKVQSYIGKFGRSESQMEMG